MATLAPYTALNWLFPRSYRAKIFAVTFIGTQLPLLTFAVIALTATQDSERHLQTLAWLLVATLAGTGATLGGLWLMLGPIEASKDAIQAWRSNQTLPQLPLGYRDTAGQLMEDVSGLIVEVDNLLRQHEHLALTDPLTGLWNRRGLERLARKRRAARDDAADHPDRRADNPAAKDHGPKEHAPKEHATWVAALDLDHFKHINDQYGHTTGDSVLRTFAGVIRACVRQNDIVARNGGEDFVIVFNRCSREEALRLCNRVRSTLSRCNILQQSVTTSIGIAALDDGEEALTDALVRADRALHRAKRNGRDRIEEDLPGVATTPRLALVAG